MNRIEGSDICMRFESKVEKCWMLIKNHIPWEQLKEIKWMNTRPAHNQAYTPTEVEHVANVITHGVCTMPSVLATCELLRRSYNFPQNIAAGIYGAALTMLFAVSTTFHLVFYCNGECQMRNVLHRCDRAMIYVFIAGSYFPWLTVGSPKCSLLEEMRWIIWLLATLGIAYQQMFHERYKRLETIFYLITGIGPSIAIVMSDHEIEGMGELKLGGLLYIMGVFFFKSDGLIPFAHAIWHIFVAVAAFIHYVAILNYLYPERGLQELQEPPVELLHNHLH